MGGKKKSERKILLNLPGYAENGQSLWAASDLKASRQPPGVVALREFALAPCAVAGQAVWKAVS